MNQKQVVDALLVKANKYHRFARWISDSETAQRVAALAEELRQRARGFANPSERRIRRRAYEIWEENSRPAGRDHEFWLQAEREFQEAEKLAKEIGEDA